MNCNKLLNINKQRNLFFIGKALNMNNVRNFRFFTGYYIENHYKSGLNTFTDEEFTKNKFSFVDENNLQRYGLDTFIKEVYLPMIDPILKIKYINWNNSWTSNKVILSEKQYYMNNLETYTELNLDPKVYKYAINKLASLEGRIDILMNMEQRRLLTISDENILSACKNGHLSVIEFFEHKYDVYNKHFTKNKELAYVVTKNNHVNILNWMLKSQLIYDNKFAYDERCVDISSEFNNVHLLNWWLNYAYSYDKCSKKNYNSFKYSCRAIDSASENGNIDALKWWEKKMVEMNIKLCYTEMSINNASIYNKIDVLNWWLNMNKNYDTELKYDKNILLKIKPSKENFITFKWWIYSGLLLPNEKLCTDTWNMIFSLLKS